MGFFGTFFSVILLLFSCMSCYQIIRNRPELFSGANLSRAFGTMGVLGLGLVLLVALLYASLPHSSGESKQTTVMSGTERSNSYDRSI